MPESPARLDLLAMYFVLHRHVYLGDVISESKPTRPQILIRLFCLYSWSTKVPKEWLPHDLTWHHRWHDFYVPRLYDVACFIHTARLLNVLPSQFAEEYRRWEQLPPDR